MNKKTLLILLIGLIILWLGAVTFIFLSQPGILDDNPDRPTVNIESENSINGKTSANVNTTVTGGSLDLIKKNYLPGEKIEFQIKDITVEYCSDGLPYSITDQGGESMNIRHSCAGTVGYGIDQYCRDGQVENRYTDDICSDAIDCGPKKVSGTFTWDQSVYTAVKEDCSGLTISREVSAQAASGNYYIILTGIDGSVYKEQFNIGGSGVSAECQADTDCATGGCSGEICGVAGLIEDVASPCLVRDYYQCYQYTSCGCVRGQCKWKENPNFNKCFSEKQGGQNQ